MFFLQCQRQIFHWYICYLPGDDHATSRLGSDSGRIKERKLSVILLYDCDTFYEMLIRKVNEFGKCNLEYFYTYWIYQTHLLVISQRLLVLLR
jgi:hypothetical protein